MKQFKTILILMIVIGAVALFAGSGTFASFSAETTNAGSSVASGTLTMSDTVDTGTACLSANAVPQLNVNPACGAVLSLTNVAPGVFGGTAQVTIQDTGSLDASTMFLWAPQVGATLSDTLSTTGAITSLPVTSLEGTVLAGDHIVVSFGTNTQSFVASTGGTAGGATSLGVNSATPNFAYPTGSIVSDTDSNNATNSAGNVDCWDAKTTSAPPSTPSATFGQQLNFNSPTGNPLCGALAIYVQETTGGNHYCWVGMGSSPENAAGLCVAPISVALTSGITLGDTVSSLSIGSLNGNVASGDHVVVRNGSTSQMFTAGLANASFGSATIPISGGPTATATFPVGSTVTDTSSLGSLNTGATDQITLTNFDTAHNGTHGKIPLTPVSGDGSTDLLAPVQLAHNASRVFQIGVYLPGPNGGPSQNGLQGLASTFGLTWHINQ
jgi:hypothetical protein